MDVPNWFTRRWMHCALRPRYLGIYAHRPNDRTSEQRPRRDHWEVYVVLAGRVTVHWYDHDHIAEAGDAYLIPPGCSWHDDLGRTAEDWSLFNCGFDFIEAGWPNPLRDLGLPVVLHYADAKTADRYCRELVIAWREAGELLADQVRLRAAIDAFIVEVVTFGFTQRVFPAKEGSAPDWLQAARGFLMRNLKHADLDTTTMAQASGCSPSHLTHAFTKCFRMPPMRYLRHERLNIAARLLRSHRDHSVRDLARRCGYQDANLFARHFRQQFGCSPTRWRSDEIPPPRSDQEFVGNTGTDHQ